MAKEDPSAVDAYGACFIHCIIGDDAFDNVFRNNYSHLVRFDEYASVGSKVLRHLENEGTPKADVAYAKILFFLERTKGKLTRRKIAFDDFQRDICAKRRDMKTDPLSRTHPEVRCWRLADNMCHAFLGRGSVFYTLDRKPDVLTPEQIAAV